MRQLGLRNLQMARADSLIQTSDCSNDWGFFTTKAAKNALSMAKAIVRHDVLQEIRPHEQRCQLTKATLAKRFCRAWRLPAFETTQLYRRSSSSRRLLVRLVGLLFGVERARHYPDHRGGVRAGSGLQRLQSPRFCAIGTSCWSAF